MQFFLLVIINIVMGAFLYLVISLKLEKSASEFREKKLKKFMDDIITEFNSTADRNIALLENKISVLKRMMEQSGEHKSIDIYSEDLEIIPSVQEKSEGIIVDSVQKESIKSENVDGTVKVKLDNRAGRASLIEKINSAQVYNTIQTSWKTAINMINKVRQSLVEKINSINKKEKPGITKSFAAREMDTILSELKAGKPETVHSVIEDKGTSIDIILDKDEIADIGFSRMDESNEEIIHDRNVMSENSLVELFSNSEDKYSLLLDLSQNGYNLEMLAKCSGIPVGEVKLVLNLKNP